MDENERQMMARQLLGRGMAGQTADTMQLRQMYQKQNIEAQMNGQEFPPFEVWAQQMRQPQPQEQPMMQLK